MRYLTCALCGGSRGTLKDIGDGKYAHAKQEDCQRQRAAEARRKAKEAKLDLVVAKGQLILPRDKGASNEEDILPRL